MKTMRLSHKKKRVRIVEGSVIIFEKICINMVQFYCYWYACQENLKKNKKIQDPPWDSGISY